MAWLPIAILSVLLAGSTFAAGATEQVLYQFQGGNDGALPYDSLLADGAGNLYGTTSDGGNGGCPPYSTSCGTVFQLSPPTQPGGAWSETVLHVFHGGSDGAVPYDGLIADGAGNLYGTTSEGGTGDCSNMGAYGCGVVFELSPPSQPGGSWSYSVIYSFQGVPSGKGRGDAAWPNRMIFGTDGNLYGFAYSGGRCRTVEYETDCTGAFFELEKTGSGSTWSETILYRFPWADHVISNPASPTLGKDGNIYGTGPGGAYGFGGIFRMKRPHKPGGRWVENTLCNFQGYGDGAFANFGLVFDEAGNLYDTSIGSGAPGNLFELSPPAVKHGAWSESVLHNFTGGDQGYNPNGSLIVGANGSLYGTTDTQAFELIPPGGPGGTWTYNVLHTFGGDNDGALPVAGLIFGMGGALYGTTVSGGGGACSSGCGTIFEIVP